MCGIAGWVDWKRDLTLYPSIIETMLETLTPCGPETTGIWMTNSCALGHRSVRENRAQTVYREEGESAYCIVFSGALSNASELRIDLEKIGYEFHIDSDAEVLLVSYIKWGHACVERLEGSFAFAVWHEREQSLFAARDLRGGEPLYYCRLENGILFSSEKKVLLMHPYVVVDRAEAGADAGIRSGADQEELQAGHSLVFSYDGLNIRPYSRVGGSSEIEPGSFA